MSSQTSFKVHYVDDAERVETFDADGPARARFLSLLQDSVCRNVQLVTSAEWSNH